MERKQLIPLMLSKSFFPFVIILLFACNVNKKPAVVMKKKDLQTNENRVIISAPIVKKKKADLSGQVFEKEEYYISRSIQDYFIKFCEGNVNEVDFKKSFESNSGLMKVMKLEVEFKSGNWDNCHESPKDGNREGEYVVIHKILD